MGCSNKKSLECDFYSIWLIISLENFLGLYKSDEMFCLFVRFLLFKKSLGSLIMGLNYKT